MDDGSRDGESAGVGANQDAAEAHELAEYDAEEWDEAVDDKPCVEGAKAEGADADESETADNERRIGVWRGGEEEG